MFGIWNLLVFCRVDSGFGTHVRENVHLMFFLVKTGGSWELQILNIGSVVSAGLPGLQGLRWYYFIPVYFRFPGVLHENFKVIGHQCHLFKWAVYFTTVVKELVLHSDFSEFNWTNTQGVALVFQSFPGLWFLTVVSHQGSPAKSAL